MISEKEKKVFLFVKQAIKENGYAPSLHEIRDALDIGYESGRLALISLERKGFILRKPDKARAIKILRMPAEASAAA